MPYLYNSSFIYYSPVGAATGPVIPHVFRNGTSLRACKKFLCSTADMSVAEWCGRCLPSKRCCWVSADSPPRAAQSWVLGEEQEHHQQGQPSSTLGGVRNSVGTLPVSAWFSF